MPDKLYVDTSFFIATQVSNHPFHQNALSALSRYQKETFYFSLLTIDEIIFTLLHYKQSPNEIEQLINDKILLIKNVKLLTYKPNINHFKQYIHLWKETGLKPRDAMHAYLMKINSIKILATYDADFKKTSKLFGFTLVGLPEKSEKLRRRQKTQPHPSPAA